MSEAEELRRVYEAGVQERRLETGSMSFSEDYDAGIAAVAAHARKEALEEVGAHFITLAKEARRSAEQLATEGCFEVSRLNNVQAIVFEDAADRITALKEGKNDG